MVMLKSNVREKKDQGKFSGKTLLGKAWVGAEKANESRHIWHKYILEIESTGFTEKLPAKFEGYWVRDA